MSTTYLDPRPTPLDEQLWEAFYSERLSLIYRKDFYGRSKQPDSMEILV
ncbi:MAG TPA: hypothetical protein VF026_01895 [Ktedonobacteraceae bacterium]